MDEEQKEREIGKLWRTWEKEELEKKLYSEKKPPLGDQVAASNIKDPFRSIMTPKSTWQQKFKGVEPPVKAEIEGEIHEEPPVPGRRVPLFRRKWVRFSVLALLVAVIVFNVWWFYDGFKDAEKFSTPPTAKKSAQVPSPIQQLPAVAPPQPAPAPQVVVPSQEQLETLTEELRGLREKVEEIERSVDQKFEVQADSLRSSLEQGLDKKLSVFQDELISQLQATIQTGIQRLPIDTAQPHSAIGVPPSAPSMGSVPPPVRQGPPPGWYVRDPMTPQ